MLAEQEIRNNSDVKEENIFLFPNLRSSGYAMGTTDIATMRKKLGISGNLTATANRHRVATLQQVSLIN